MCVCKLDRGGARTCVRHCVCLLEGWVGKLYNAEQGIFFLCVWGGEGAVPMTETFWKNILENGGCIEDVWCHWGGGRYVVSLGVGGGGQTPLLGFMGNVALLQHVQKTHNVFSCSQAEATSPFLLLFYFHMENISSLFGAHVCAGDRLFCVCGGGLGVGWSCEVGV